jgi:hypothetical protein
MKKITFSILLMGMGLLGFSQYIPVDIRFYGGSSFEDINCLYPLENGDFIFAGGTRSSDGDLEPNNGNEDCWFVHLDSDLNIIKSVSFGESEYESIRDVIALSDTSFLFLISSNSNTGIFSNSNGSTDAWIRTHYYPDWFSPAHPLGGSDSDILNHISKKAIGEGYLAFGTSHSDDGDLSENYGNLDFWVINLTSELNVVWSRNYGGSGHETAIKGFQLESGNLMVFGNTSSNNHMVHNHKGVVDAWVIKLNSMGDTIWTKCYGGSEYDEIINVQQIDSDLFAITGYSYSTDGDFLFMKNSKISNGFGFYYIINSDGDFVAGGSLMLPNNNLRFMNMLYESENEITLLGLYDTDPDEMISNIDILIADFNEDGLQSSIFFGGDYDDGYDKIHAVKINDTDFLLGTTSYSDDLAPDYHGNADVMIAQLTIDETNSIIADFKILDIYPNPAKSEIFLSELSIVENWNYQIFDLKGNLIKTEKIKDSRNINISNLCNGSYILSVSNGITTIAGKFSIQR